MSLVIELAPEAEIQLQQQAASQGLNASEYARRLIESHLPDKKSLQLAYLMHSWIEEDTTDDPEELERRETEWQELKANLNAHHSSNRTLFP